MAGYLEVRMDNITVIAYFAILLWGICTTVYGLYLSRRNNELYNKKILQELEDINSNLEEMRKN